MVPPGLAIRKSSLVTFLARRATLRPLRSCDCRYTQPMDHLWTPWRYTYVSTADDDRRKGVPAALSEWPGDHQCVFCNMIAAVDFAVRSGMPTEEAEKAAGIIHRATLNFICLNAYPYATGHVMIVPYRHGSSLAALDTATTHEMMDIAQKTESSLDTLYHPHGMNFGLNLGKAAGAGIADHLHLHALPRWTGDTNFMTTVAETRVLPESLDMTWQRMREIFPK
jgi:ATP adenylyltransferase